MDTVVTDTLTHWASAMAAFAELDQPELNLLAFVPPPTDGRRLELGPNQVAPIEVEIVEPGFYVDCIKHHNLYFDYALQKGVCRCPSIARVHQASLAKSMM